MKVKDLMSTVVEFATPTTSAKDAAHQMHETHVGALPVVDDEKVVGMITDRDICCKVIATGHSAGRTPLDEIMSKDVATCFEDDDIGEATSLMVDKHVRRLVVVNHDNKLVGLLSIDDLARGSHDMASSILEASAQLH